MNRSVTNGYPQPSVWSALIEDLYHSTPYRYPGEWRGRILNPIPSITGGYPQDWRAHIDDLRQERKWRTIRILAGKYIRNRRSLPELITIHRASFHTPLHNLLVEEIDAWCNIYNRLGRAYFEIQRYDLAEQYHWIALGLWMCLCSDCFKSSGFRSNVEGLYQALLGQGPQRENIRRVLDNLFSKGVRGEPLFHQRQLSMLG